MQKKLKEMRNKSRETRIIVSENRMVIWLEPAVVNEPEKTNSLTRLVDAG